MQCYDHPSRVAVTNCTRCGRPLCRECAERYTPVPVCRHCAELEFADRRREAIKELIYMGIGGAIGFALGYVSAHAIAEAILAMWIGAGYVPAFQMLRNGLQRALSNIIMPLEQLGLIGMIVVFVPAFFLSFVALPWQAYRCYKELKL